MQAATSRPAHTPPPDPTAAPPSLPTDPATTLDAARLKLALRLADLAADPAMPPREARLTAAIFLRLATSFEASQSRLAAQAPRAAATSPVQRAQPSTAAAPVVPARPHTPSTPAAASPLPEPVVPRASLQPIAAAAAAIILLLLTLLPQFASCAQTLIAAASGARECAVSPGHAPIQLDAHPYESESHRSQPETRRLDQARGPRSMGLPATAFAGAHTFSRVSLASPPWVTFVVPPRVRTSRASPASLHATPSPSSA